MKRILSFMMAVVIMAALIPAASAAGLEKLNYENIVGSTWYGEYTAYYNNTGKPYRQATTLTFDSCDEAGNFTSTTYSRDTTNSNWCTISEKGTIDFSTGAFYMEEIKILKHKGTWHLDKEPTYATIDDEGIRGSYMSNRGNEITFYWARTSAWALDEITEANVAELIPDTLKGADLTQRITRAEFAAVAANLYEKLSGSTIEPYAGNELNDIAGNVNETNIRKAYAANIAVGVGDGMFAPDTDLNREQLATMLTRVIKKYSFPEWTYDTDSKYYLDTSGVKIYADDANIADWAKPSVYYLTKMEVINGIDNNNFGPKAVSDKEKADGYATATREQAIVMALRIYKISDMLK